MKRLQLLVLIALFASPVVAQRMHVGVFGGVAAYNGDLTENIFPKKVTNGAIGLTLNYDVTDHITVRGGFTYAIVGGADRFSDKPDNVMRNLSFETRLYEFSAVGEYYLLDLNLTRYSPYAFVGVAAFKFDPYAYDLNKNQVFLKPLSTEGQGIAGYSTKPYKLTQLAIPFGIGFKFAITDNLRIGLEGGLRKTFTDYLDDVSTGYIAEADLLAAKGQLAVDMSYRGDEIAGGDPVYPAKAQQRGSPKAKDYYYFTGLHLTYRFGGGGGYGGGKRSRLGCPTNIY
jgi:hypothetical protein